MTIDRANDLVRRWKPAFGLADFRIRVQELPPESPEGWALSHYDVDEMWGVLDIPGDGTLPDALQELLVLHELAHGLLQVAKGGKLNVEQTCNRIARLAKGDFHTPLANETYLEKVGDEEFFSTISTKRNRAGGVDRRAWLPIVADALPPKEREVINLLYWDGKSLREAADELAVSYETVRRWRDSALDRLGRYFAALDRQEFSTTEAARRVIALQEPEGGAEHGVIYELHHRCPAANALIRTKEVGREDLDLLVFPVGNYGYGMPKGVPFAVTSLDECGGCGQLVGAWFVWQAGKTSHPGSIWTPS